MMNKITPVVIFSLLALVITGLLTGIIFWMAPAENKLQRAFESYQIGENARTVVGREQGFNQALNLYTDLDRVYDPNRGNGKLYYNIANSFFQLEQYPFAILYYNRAHNLMPRSKKVVNNLKIAQSKVGIKEGYLDQTFEKLFFFHTYFSNPEKHQLFFAFSIFTLIASSAYIWLKIHFIKKTAFFLIFICSVFLFSIAYSHYIAPTEAIIVNASMLYRDAGKQYTTVSDKPIISGLKVRVLDVLNDGGWLKIETDDGKLGYVPYESVRLI